MNTNPINRLIGRQDAALALKESAAQEATPVAAPNRREVTQPEVLVMIDIESLATSSLAVITQIAMVGYDLETDSFLEASHQQFYPIDPQFRLNPPREVSGDTLAWWMTQDIEARKRINMSTATDYEDIPANLRHLVRTFGEMVGNRPYEVCAKGPQFDIAAVESLMNSAGIAAPWKYNKVTDLRTYMKAAGITEDYVPTPTGFIPHVAYWDARYQVALWLESAKRLRAG